MDTAVTTTEEILGGLEDAGFPAFFMHPPTEIEVPIAHLDGSLYLTRGHNRDGWEAVFDTGWDQRPLEDGPDENADSQRIVRWVRQLIIQVEDGAV